MGDWRIRHGEAIDSFLKYLNSETTSFVLKGGTALMKCYSLDRFSEDIDLDSTPQNAETLKKLIARFCNEAGYSSRTAKDTDTVQRHMLNYGNTQKPLKIEVSFRRREIRAEDVISVNDITTYDINVLCIMKSNAYSARDKLRDLFDLAFICNNYYDELNHVAKEVMRLAVENKGIEQFDYIIREQTDELIDIVKLEDSFLKMYDKLGLLYTRDEKAVTEPPSLRDTLAANQIKAAEQNTELPTPPAADKPKTIDE